MLQRSEKQIELRFFLRERTHHCHEALDAAFAGLDLSVPADYRAFLKTSAAALLPLEQLLETSGIAALLPDWPQRRRSPALLSDCKTLSVCVEMLTLSRASMTSPEIIGAAYVLEGSRLGARLLIRQVQLAQSAEMTEAQNYLSHGAADKLWPGFLARLEELAPAIDFEKTAEGAGYAFSVFAEAARRFLATPPLAEVA